jgi:DNA-binding IclR family transcriptional regulator
MSEAGRGLSTARSVLQVLTLLAEHPEGVSAGDVAARVGKSTSTAYYLLASLCEEGFARREGSGRYRLQPFAAPPASAPVPDDALGLEGILDDLHCRTRKRCYLGRLERGAIEIVGVRGRQGLPKMPGLGTRIEQDVMHALAMGKVVLSLLGPEARGRYARRPLQAFTDATITSPEGLLAELDDARTRGVAVEREEFEPDFCCVAAPVLDARGRFLATVGLSVTTRTFDLERDALTTAVREVASASNHVHKTAEILPVAAATA